MTLTLHRFVPLLALAFPGDALAQNAPEPPVNNGHDLTRPLHSITVFQNYTAPSDGINSYTTTLRYERPVYLQDNWKFAYRFELLRPIATDVGLGCDGRFGVARRAAQRRTAKPCGPDTPTLVSSFAGCFLRNDGGYQARYPEESAV